MLWSTAELLWAQIYQLGLNDAICTPINVLYIVSNNYYFTNKVCNNRNNVSRMDGTPTWCFGVSVGLTSEINSSKDYSTTDQSSDQSSIASNGGLYCSVIQKLTFECSGAENDLRACCSVFAILNTRQMLAQISSIRPMHFFQKTTQSGNTDDNFINANHV